MARDHGEINDAALCDLGDRAGAGAFDETSEYASTGWVAEGFKPLWIEEVVDGKGTCRGLFGRKGGKGDMGSFARKGERSLA